jgi:hypothetical protein
MKSKNVIWGLGGAALFTSAFSLQAAPITLEQISPHFSTNTQIIWQAPTNHLPKSFWIYKKLPQTFSQATISNAIILASFQGKGFPKPSTNRVVLWAEGFDGEPQPPNFAILPDVGQLSFTLGDRRPNCPEGIATNQAAVERAWNCLAQLGLTGSYFVKTNDSSSGGYGVFIPRQIDGIQVCGGSEGFQIQFGKQKFLQFCLLFPNLERDKQSQVASPQQIIACIRACKTPVVPGDKPDYFARVKSLAKAKALTITKITPYYGEGVYGEAPTNGEPSKIITPIVVLEAIADFGSSNATVRLFSPILSSEVGRLLGK